MSINLLHPPLSLSLIVNPSGKAKVTNLELHLIIEEKVAKLQVTVDDLVVMQVLHTKQQLSQEVSRLGLSDGLPPLVQLHHGLAATTKVKIW